MSSRFAVNHTEDFPRSEPKFAPLIVTSRPKFVSGSEIEIIEGRSVFVSFETATGIPASLAKNWGFDLPDEV